MSMSGNYLLMSVLAVILGQRCSALSASAATTGATGAQLHQADISTTTLLWWRRPSPAVVNLYAVSESRQWFRYLHSYKNVDNGIQVWSGIAFLNLTFVVFILKFKWNVIIQLRCGIAVVEYNLLLMIICYF